jgi:uncharacterized SAM-binding protein YcdF (DUF218 family)
MIYLNKLLPVFFLPTGATLLLVVAGLLLRRTWLCWLGVALLWLASTPLVGDYAMRAAEGWQVRQPIAAMPTTAAIVVLSGGRTYPPGDPSAVEYTDAIDRYHGGVALYLAGKAPRLVFTGAWLPWRPSAPPEGEAMAALAVADGVPEDAILTTGPVVNTAAEAQAVAELLAAALPPDAPRRVTLVTSAYHMARARLLFEHAGLAVTPFPVDFQSDARTEFSLLDLLPTASSLRQTELALREAYGLFFYQLSPAQP